MYGACHEEWRVDDWCEIEKKGIVRPGTVLLSFIRRIGIKSFSLTSSQDKADQLESKVAARATSPD